MASEGSFFDRNPIAEARELNLLLEKPSLADLTEPFGSIRDDEFTSSCGRCG